ncbi:MAG: class IV adenylate cyclase [Patescibacteria group bacterium]|jgi:predicted adenylyl cyclase CyaB
MPREIEIQVKIENIQPLLGILKNKGKLKYQTRQVDKYYTPADRDFTVVRPIAEWLRLRDAEGEHSINYKNWHFSADGRSEYCDEHETPVENIEAMREIFQALKFRKLVAVDKTRQAWQYQDWEVAIDKIKNLGDFVEIEYKGNNNPEPKEETDKMIDFLKQLDGGKIERNYRGYPFQLLFPDEVKWEVM